MHGDLNTIPEPLYHMRDGVIADDNHSSGQEDSPVLSWHNDRPTTIREAQKSVDLAHWKRAMYEQTDRFEKLGIYTVVEHPGPEHTIISGRRVFARKVNNQGGTI